MIRPLLRFRYASFAAVALLLAVLLARGRHVTYEQSIQSFFAEDDPAVRSYQEAARSFGNDQFVFVAYDDPDVLTPAGIGRVAELAEAVGPTHLDGVVRVESLDAMPVLWQLDDQLLLLERLPEFLRRRALDQAKAMLRSGGAGAAAPTLAAAIRSASAATLGELRARITAHPLLRGTLIAADGKSTALVVRLKSPTDHDVKATVAGLRRIGDDFAGRHQLGRPAIVGPPVLLADGFAAIERDGQNLALAGMALIGLVTLTATGSVWWAIVPILAGWVVWLATETMLATLGIKLSLSGGPLVAQIIVLTMPAASHLAIHFRDERRQGAGPEAAARLTLRAVASPILWCAITGAIGYGALMTSNVVPVSQFGAILAACTLVAALLTMAISPMAMMPPTLGRRAGPLGCLLPVVVLAILFREHPRLDRRFFLEAAARLVLLYLAWWVVEALAPLVRKLVAPITRTGSRWISATLAGATALALRRPAAVVGVVLAVVLPIVAGIPRLTYESNYINAFKPESRVVRDYHFVESRLGGIGLIALVEPVGKAITPKSLDAFRTLDREIAGLRDAAGAPAVAQVVSLATVLDPDGKLAALPPATRARALADKLELIDASPQGSLLGGFWNRGTGFARVLVRVSEQQPSPAKEATFKRALGLAQSAFGPETYLTGLSYLLTQTTRAMIATQWSTFYWSAGGILLMLTIAFRGPVLALLAILPTMLAVGLVLGLMGWIGIKLDLATALVASVALGLSVDDTFHCLLQFRRHRAGVPFRRALLDSYAVTGPGVLLSSVAVALGFAVLRVSEFTPFALFGTMVCIATAGSSLGNLILLPACLSLGHSRADRLGEDAGTAATTAILASGGRQPPVGSP